jgi:putative tricarboxylic transport membrane protein
MALVLQKFVGLNFFCCIGTYSVNNSLEDVYITAAFGFMGYMFVRLELDPSPLMLGFILGRMLEENFRRALLLSRGSFTTFFNRPIAGSLMALIGVFVSWQLIAFALQVRRKSVLRQQVQGQPLEEARAS